MCRTHGTEDVKTGNVNSSAVAAKSEEADLDFSVPDPDVHRPG
ncbi:hypothetical protein [Streptomyces sp. NPDC001450]